MLMKSESQEGVMKRVWIWLFAMLLILPVAAAGARARVEVVVNLSTQRMSVKVDGRHYATWPVSTGRRGYYTPRGTYRPRWLKRMHYSRKYDNAPMPHSIFFRGGYAIHGTNIVSRLGRPASHGCIRLHPSHAAELFRLVQRHGRSNTIIRIIGSTNTAYARLPRRKTTRHRNLRRYSRSRHLAALRKRRQSRRRAPRGYRPPPPPPEYDFIDMLVFR